MKNKELVKSRRLTPVLNKTKENKLLILKDINMLNEVNILLDR